MASSVFGSTTSPRVNRPPLSPLGSLPRQTRAASSRAPSPERRTTPMAPLPGGVAMAQMGSRSRIRGLLFQPEPPGRKHQGGPLQGHGKEHDEEDQVKEGMGLRNPGQERVGGQHDGHRSP